MLFWLFTITFLLWTEKAMAQKFRDDYMYAQRGKTFYLLHDMATSWDQAVQICLAEGTSLLKPDSLEEVENLKLLMSNMRAHYTAVFVGLHDKFSNGDFVTLKGEPVAGTVLDLLWAPGSPNNETLTSAEHCVVMSREGMLDDRPCGFIYPFFCKIHGNDTRYNEDCRNYDVGYKLQDNGKCYKYHTEPLSWHDAYMICKAEEGSLLVVNSEEEATLVTSIMGKHLINKAPNPNILLIGFSDLMFQYEYRTIKGAHSNSFAGQTLEEANYSSWAPFTDDVKEMQDKRCGAMSMNGYYLMTWCDLPAMFICERQLASNSTENKSKT